MPKVTFLQDLCSGVAGSVHELQQYEADVLVRMGVAELHQDESTGISTEGLLTNLNGTPVVSDFGDLVPEQTAAATESQAAKKEAKKK